MTIIKRIAIPLTLVLVLAACSSRKPIDPLTADTGGPLSDNERATDVLSYDLELEVFPGSESIRGIGTTVVRALETIDTVELQLDARLSVDEIRVDGNEVDFTRDGGVITIALPRRAGQDDEVTVAIDYGGQPFVAPHAPWRGGFVWAETESGQPWIATAVQGEGCDLWWPCKDHFADKPDRMTMRVTVPAGLSAAMNGVLESIVHDEEGHSTFNWKLGVPVSPYNISLNVGPFTRIETSYKSVNGSTVPIEFWALEEHEEKARNLIENDLRHELEWYERRLGPFPWGGEKLGLVETPHLGMEHQTIIAYGNKFRRDDHGFDWLLQHELAHEWFGNLMTHKTNYHIWLHEGFGAYMQPAYSLDRDGTAAYMHKMYKTYLGLENCTPIVQEGVKTSAELYIGDIYGKGSWILHSLRWLVGEEAFWNSTRRLLYDTDSPWELPYPIQPVFRDTEDLVRIVSEEAGQDLTWFFDVYAREADLPTLVTERNDDGLTLRWTVPGEKPFPMPVPVSVDGTITIVEMPEGLGTLNTVAGSHVIVDPEMRVLRQLSIIGTWEETMAERGE